MAKTLKFAIEEEESMPIMELRLVRRDNKITLVGRTERGTEVNLMNFFRGGFERVGGMSFLGALKTDEEGRIEEL